MTPPHLRAAVGLLSLLLALPAYAASTPSPTPEPEAPIQVNIAQILPRSPQPDSVVVVSGTLRNAGSVPVTRLRWIMPLQP